jgi:hypothetical protein
MQTEGSASTATDEEVYAKLREDLTAIMWDAKQVLKQRAGSTQSAIEIEGPALGPIVVKFTSVMPGNIARSLLRTTADFSVYETHNGSEIGAALTEIDAYRQVQLYPVEPECYPSDYGLYNMARTVSEWTSTSCDESLYGFSHDLGSSYNFEASAFADSMTQNRTTDARDFEFGDSLTAEQRKEKHPLFSMFSLAAYQDQNYDGTVWEKGCRVGKCLMEATAEVSKMLTDPEVLKHFPDEGKYLKLLWQVEPIAGEERGRIEYYLSV